MLRVFGPTGAQLDCKEHTATTKVRLISTNAELIRCFTQRNVTRNSTATHSSCSSSMKCVRWNTCTYFGFRFKIRIRCCGVCVCVRVMFACSTWPRATKCVGAGKCRVNLNSDEQRWFTGRLSIQSLPSHPNICTHNAQAVYWQTNVGTRRDVNAVPTTKHVRVF